VSDLAVSYKAVLDNALNLSPLDRASLIERLFESFGDMERQGLDAEWASEVEDRLEAHKRGEMKSKPANEVFRAIE